MCVLVCCSTYRNILYSQEIHSFSPFLALFSEKHSLKKQHFLCGPSYSTFSLLSKLCMCSSYILYVSRDAVVELDGSRSENEPPRRCSCPCPPLLCSPYSTRDMVYTRTGWSLMAVVFCSTIK